MVLCRINRYQNLPGGREGEAPLGFACGEGDPRQARTGVSPRVVPMERSEMEANFCERGGEAPTVSLVEGALSPRDRRNAEGRN